MSKSARKGPVRDDGPYKTIVGYPRRLEGCYLLHFDRPLCHARHYLGWSWNIHARVGHHARQPDRPHMMLALQQAGIAFTLVRIWEGYNRDQERKLKRRHHGPRLCPLCNAAVMNSADYHYLRHYLEEQQRKQQQQRQRQEKPLKEAVNV